MVRVPKKTAALKRKPHKLERKRNRLERLALRRGVRYQASRELMKLATILSPQ
jgi:hypothetical protein